MPENDVPITQTQEPVLFELVQDAIKKIARSYKTSSVTMQTTEIVHEGYLRLVKEGSKKWEDKNAYLAAFAITMRRYLIDHYRKKTALKKGGYQQNFSLDELAIEFPAPDGFTDWLELDYLINQLEAIDPLVSEILQLKYFAGLTTQEVADVIKKDPRTVSRKWQFARAWLHHKLTN